MLKFIVPLKITLTFRECQVEMDDDDDNPEHVLATHYYKFHFKLFYRCKKCMQRLYSDYHFKDRCIDKRTCIKLSVHSYFGYTDINNSVNDDYDSNKILNELKKTVKEDLKRIY